MDVPRILEDFRAQPESVRRYEKRVDLIAAGRSVRANLVVERDDVVAIV